MRCDFMSSNETLTTKKYVTDLLYLKGLPRAYSSIIHQFSEKLLKTEDGLKLYLTAGMKQEFANELGVSIGYINNCITDLAKANILLKLASGTYILSHDLFGEYDWIDLEDIKSITLSKEYVADEEKVYTKFKHKKTSFLLRLDPEPDVSNEIDDVDE